MANLKKALLQKMVEGTLYDLMIRTRVDNIVVSGEGGTEVYLSTVLAQMLGDLDGLGALAKKDQISEIDLVAALAAKINGKADKGTTLVAYGIADAYTKAQVDGLVSGVLHFKGTKDYQSALPSSGNTLGDVWLVRYKGTSGTVQWNAEFLWGGTAWEMIGTADDMSGYVTAAEMNSALAGKAPTAHASTATTYGAASAANYGHAKASTTVPKANGTAAVGAEESSFARGDHVHPLQTTVSGNAGTATKLQTPQSIALSGGATGTATNFDGSAPISIPVTGLDMSKANAGILPLARGGTGSADAATARSNLGASQVRYGASTPADLGINDLFIQLID